MPTDPPAEKPVTPRPGLPRAIGLLNLAIGGMFFFCGLEWLRDYGPALDQHQPHQLDAESAQQWYEGLRKIVVVDLREREDEAASPDERARLRREREAMEAKNPRIADQLNLKAYNAGSRWLTWYLWADIITAPVLNLLLLASGIGLIQLREWARRMGIWVAALKIVRLVALSLFLILVVIPRASPAIEAFIVSDLGRTWIAAKTIVPKANRGSAKPPRTVDPKELGPVLQGASTIGTVLMLGLFVIYPSIALALLSRPSSRAACVAAEEAEAEEEMQW